jgi:hypothetical protein
MSEILDSELHPVLRGAGLSKSRSLLIALALAVGVYSLFFLFFDPGYGTNDDFGMMALASGLFRSEASPFLIFTHVSIGYVLKALYGWAPSIPWYAVYLYSFQILAWTLIAHALLTIDRAREAVIFFAASFLLIGFPIAMKLQFTSTSILLGAAAAFYFLTMGLQSRSWMLPAFAGGLIGIVGLIRGSSLKVTLAIWAPLFVYTAFRTPIKRTLVFGATIASVVLAAAAISMIAYNSDSRWDEYVEFNAVRGQLHGNANFDPSEETLAEIGWERSDLRLFRHWFFTDPDVFSTEHLRALLGSIQPRSRWENFSHKLIVKPFSESKSQLIGALLITLTLLAWATRKRISLVLANWVWIALVGTAAIILYGRMPPRVLVPMILSATLASAIIAGIPRVTLRPVNIRQRVCLLFTILILLMGAVRVQTALAGWMQESRDHAERETKLMRFYEGLHALDPHGVFIHQPPGIRNERLSPLANGSGLPGIRFIWLGWQIRSPSWLDELDTLEIDDLYTAITQREHTYLITTRKAKNKIPSLMNFLKIHRGIAFNLNATCVDSECRIVAWSPDR